MNDEHPSRLQLLRLVLVFQFKLALDGLRDVLLSPISLGAALLGILTSPDDPAKFFRRLLEIGHDSDRWINLFNTYDEEDGPSSDTLVRQAEKIVKDELGDLLQEQKSADRANRPPPT